MFTGKFSVSWYSMTFWEFVQGSQRTPPPAVLVYDIQRKIIVAGSEWNIDLVLGPPPRGLVKEVSARGIQKASPATIRVAIEAKTIMTEHGKARRNRQRDLDSFHQFVHRYDPETVAAGLTVVNLAERFKSPLRPEPSSHRNVRALVQETMALFRSLPQRSARGESPGLEANGAIVVSHDNIDLSASTLVTAAPAPQVGDPIQYESFLRRIHSPLVRPPRVGPTYESVGLPRGALRSVIKKTEYPDS
jgi:hypothetical protein